ncbi:hypothetical protein BJ508DRAFT_417388 [Ascobolus immersus RN42]|uniref:Extracellular membrane protein CFEM domain-containing protein n=1 Tax=Ascobolus immersus RN42 TaxID=1160509 RepID=A0A3N4HT62_ASCIM|nr:hypothetical protein BJ508DRAFT_417388 [Ascobolus immersus RN42]
MNLLLLLTILTLSTLAASSTTTIPNPAFSPLTTHFPPCFSPCITTYFLSLSNLTPECNLTGKLNDKPDWKCLCDIEKHIKPTEENDAKRKGIGEELGRCLDVGIHECSRWEREEWRVGVEVFGGFCEGVRTGKGANSSNGKWTLS